MMLHNSVPSELGTGEVMVCRTKVHYQGHLSHLSQAGDLEGESIQKGILEELSLQPHSLH